MEEEKKKPTEIRRGRPRKLGRWITRLVSNRVENGAGSGPRGNFEKIISHQLVRLHVDLLVSRGSILMAGYKVSKLSLKGV